MNYLSVPSKHQLGWESFTLEIGLSKKTSHPLALTIHKWQFHKWEKKFFSWIIPIFYRNYWYPKVPNPSINQIQVELVWPLMLCHVASLFTFPLLPNLSRSLLAFSNSQFRPLRCSIQSWHVSMSAFIYDLCHNCHRISIIGVIDVINVRGI